MKNISFDNPYWLFIAIPLLLLLFVPFFITVNKDNRSKGFIASVILHVMIISAVALAAAGLTHTTVITRTKIYVVCDLSHSSHRNLDVIDGYIDKINDSLPDNSRLGIVCFGKDPVILTSSGEEIRSVKEAKVDDSGTDIAGALSFTADLFSEDELKRVILITDGFDTTSDGRIISAVEKLSSKGIRLDAIYLDNNLKDGEAEIQISDALYTKSTYLDHKTELRLQLESSVEADVIVDLYRRGRGESEYNKIDTTVITVDKGINLVSFTLPTDTSGVFEYKASLTSSRDSSKYNNEYLFTQSVAGKKNVLLITEKSSDLEAIEALYSDSCEIDSYLISRNRNVPYTVEALTKYDEIILSNVDIRNINNINAFLDSCDIVVSQYGKSLITFGDLKIQNKDEEIFKKLEELLPVSFGNANKDAKLYTILLDISRSMNDTSQLIVAKDAAIKLLSLLDDEDYVAYVTLAGEAVVEQLPTRLGDIREELYKEIQSASPTQGTYIGAAMKQAYDTMRLLSFEEKQVMLISDGLTFAHEPEDAVAVAEKMKNDGITVSTVNVLSGNVDPAVRLLSDIAAKGGGNYYLLDRAENVSELVFATIADELTESIVEKDTAVKIETFRDDTLDGILSLPNVSGYVNSKAKLDATMVLSVAYEKSSKSTVDVPLYSYREHGNGRVSTFTSSLSGDWLDGWSKEDKSRFFGNVIVTNTPKERTSYPFVINFEYGGDNSTIEILPTYLNPKAKASVKLTSPGGKVTTTQPIFDLNKYVCTVKTTEIGNYRVEINYSYGNHTFTSDTYFDVSYYPEYDSFTTFDISSIYDFMNGVGEILDGDIPKLENDKTDISTFEYSFRMPLFILAAALFVVDVFIRKIRWKDIVGLFRGKKAKGEGR